MANHLETGGGATLAETLGLTEELGRFIAGVAAEELAAGRIENAREIAEGLAVWNPHDAAPWTMLSLVHRRRGSLVAARVCAEAARLAAPLDEQVRLVRAEILLTSPQERSTAKEELAALGRGEGEAANRARALLSALVP